MNEDNESKDVVSAADERFLPVIPASELPDFSSMTEDELIEYRVAQKQAMYLAKARIRASTPEYVLRVHQNMIATKLRAVGLEGIEVTPDKVEMYMRGEEVKAAAEIASREDVTDAGN